MSLINRLWVTLISIPAEMFERAFWYVLLAAIAWLALHVVLARRLKHRRISAKQMTARQIGQEVLYSARSVVVYGLMGGFMVFAVISGWTPMYFRIDRYGWGWFVASIAVTIVIHDAYFYWTHRLMHHPRLFRWLHRTHHRSTNPSPWAAYSFSTGEALVQAGIAPLVIFTLPLHPLAFSIFMVWQMSFNVLGHCGFELFPRWFVRSWCGRILNTATHHAQHHETNRANFSLYFNYWDRLMGTNHQQYAERFAVAVGSGEVELPASRAAGRKLTRSCTAAVIFLLAFLIPARTPAAEPAALDAAFELVEGAVKKGEIPGAVALVSQNGKIVREQAYGLADVEHKIPFTPRTICWIASITKPVTVAAAMKLVEDGRLSLDDPVEKYIPEFAEMKDKEGKHHAITIRQLMCHTSGIQANPPTRPSFFFAQEFLGRKIEEISAAIAQTPLQFTPGSQAQYSNAAPYVLARVIELRTGKPFHEHVRETILAPAGMRDSYFIIPASEAKRTAVVYRDTKEERVEFFRFNPEWKVTMTLPDGGLFSSPREIAKFLQVFLDDDGGVLAKSSVKAMRERQSAGWGLGWGLEESGAFHHSGSSGVTAWADPKTGVVGVLFCQLQNPDKVSPLQTRFRKSVREAFPTP